MTTPPNQPPSPPSGGVPPQPPYGGGAQPSQPLNPADEKLWATLIHVGGIFFNQGEVCAAGTRVLVHRSLYSQVVDGLAEPLLHLGGAGARDGALQREPDREQPLDHMVVQVAGDAVTVGQYVEFTQSPLCGGQLPRQRRLVHERGHHVELTGVECARTGRAQRDQNPGDGVGGADGHDQRRPGGDASGCQL